MSPLSPTFLILLAASLLFAYLDGISDSANVVAPAISVHALSPRRALVITTIAVTVAPFVFAATFREFLCRCIPWWLGPPPTSPHASPGGLGGAGRAGAGLGAVNLFG